MKKAISLALLLIVLAGCKKKDQQYKEELNGTWLVYKYLLNNIDQTPQFQNRLYNYRISFTTAGAFTESFQLNKDTPTVVTTGTYHFADNYNKIALDNTLIIQIDSTHVYDSVIERLYTMFDLTAASVQFTNDTSRIYLNKKP